MDGMTESALTALCSKVYWAVESGDMDEARNLVRPALDYAQIINSLAFLTDEQRAGFFALLGASYCLKCGKVRASDPLKVNCHCYLSKSELLWKIENARNWIMANTKTPAHDILKTLDTQ